MKSPDWKYSAIVLRIIDGDTIECLVDLGFNLSNKIRVRIRNFDAPELNSKTQEELVLAKAAKSKAEQLLPIGEKITIRTYKDPGVYNRYEADVQLKDGRDFASAMVEMHLAKSDVVVKETELEPT